MKKKRFEPGFDESFTLTVNFDRSFWVVHFDRPKWPFIWKLILTSLFWPPFLTIHLDRSFWVVHFGMSILEVHFDRPLWLFALTVQFYRKIWPFSFIVLWSTILTVPSNRQIQPSTSYYCLIWPSTLGSGRERIKSRRKTSSAAGCPESRFGRRGRRGWRNWRKKTSWTTFKFMGHL